MSLVQESVRLGGHEVSFETGEIARQAGGSIILTAGDTVLMAVVTAEAGRSPMPFMPLTVEYRNKYAGAGRIPGSYDRREARGTDLETLTCRLIDRSIRPLFHDDWRSETQVIVHPLSYEPGTDPSVLAISAASAALAISDVPWDGPVAGVRVARVDGQLVAFPSGDDLERADLDLIVTTTRDGIVMVEGGGSEIPEDVVRAAFDLAQEASRPIHDLVDRLREAAGKPKREVPQPPEPSADERALRERVETEGRPRIVEALGVHAKHERYAALEAATRSTLEALGVEPGADVEATIKGWLGALKKRVMRAEILAGRRIGGRSATDIRQITGKAGWLKRAHGSSLFTRGETQAIVTCTLGQPRDAQRLETLDGEIHRRFLLHYNFPPYSVGEVRPIRGPGRREIGHGHLARRALEPLIPSQDEAPYTVRLESTITESNGSSSMASICGGSLALMDAGLPIARPVAGIAMGLVQEGDQHVVLSDILGDEDHIGDMDFKVGGTEVGVTAIQLDNKLGAVPPEVMQQALEQARQGRLHILGEMGKILPQRRDDLSLHAPRVAAVRIDRNRVRDLIGPGGAHIRGIQETTGASIDVDDAGVVRIFAKDKRALEQARADVDDLTGVPVLGETYTGRVTAAKHFGSFVRLFEGVEGLLPGVELGVGVAIKVVVSGVNFQGKLELARA